MRYGMEYLVTWNCRHIANAWMRSEIEEIIRELGCEPPTLCARWSFWRSEARA